MANLDSSNHVEVERPWLSISPYTGIVRMKASSLLSRVLPCWSGVPSRASFAPIMQPSNRGQWRSHRPSDVSARPEAV
eukprot:scaffold29742_cov80-Cyclotella_meneghiniana.AAC.1